MRLKPIAALAALCMALAFTGCSAMLEREYLSTRPHVEQYNDDTGSDALVVENYLGLKNAIIKFVEEGAEKGMIRISNYPGSPDEIAEDVRSAISEVSKNDPLGAYATNYIMGDFNRIVSYYEVNISIVFSHTVEDMDRIRRVRTNSDIRDNVMGALEGFETNLLLRTSYFSELDYEELIRELYYQNPQLAFGMPEVAVEYYPSSGIQRIIELNFSYPYDDTQLGEYVPALDRAARRITGSLDMEQEPPELAFSLYKLLAMYTYYDHQQAEAAALDDSASKGLEYTAYGALVRRIAVSEGYAMAFKLLCDRTGIECHVVTGRKNGDPAAWNIINLYGDYYHVDAAAAVLEEAGFLLSDEDISEAYKWNTELYPECDGPLSVSDVLPAQQAGADAFDAAARQEGVPADSESTGDGGQDDDGADFDNEDVQSAQFLENE